jgi:WD40 repeat protein
MLRALAWAPNSEFLASAAADQTVRVWEVQTGKEQRIYRGHTTAVMSVAYHPSGRQLASADVVGVVKQWDATQDQRARTVPRAARLSALVFTADGRELRAAAVPPDGEGVRGWDATTGQLRLERHIVAGQRREWPLKYVDFSADGRLFAAPANKDPSRVCVWDVAAGEEVASFGGHQGRVRALAMSPDGTLLASASSERGGDGRRELFVWRVELPEAHPTEPVRLACRAPVQCLAFSSDGSQLVSGDWGTQPANGEAWRDGCLTIWESATGRLVRSWIAHPGAVQSVAFDPRGRYLASAGRSQDQSVRVWDVASGRLLHTLQGPRALTCVTFSPDGKRLVAVGYEGMVHLWDPVTGQDVLMLRGLGEQMPEAIANDTQVVFSPDGTQLAVNSWRGAIYVWDGRPLAP